MTHLKNIKKLFFAFALLTGFAACNNNPSNSRNIRLLSDSSAYHNNSSTDSARRSQSNVVPYGNVHHSNAVGYQNSGVPGNSGTVSHSASSASTQTMHKKGWSKSAKGAVIGGAAGAVGGAIISRHKGTGAAIGAVVGAAGGYLIGHHKDKKDGRVQ